MKKLLSIAAVIAVIGIAGVGAMAAQDESAYSARAALLGKQAPAAKLQVSVVSAQRLCPLCRVATKVSEQVASKPGHGTIQANVFVDQCPGCGGKMAVDLKQTEYVHTCTHHCCGA